jgi:hypothetical protein
MDALAHTDCTQLIKKLQRMPFRWDAERLLFFLSLCITIISAPRTYGTLLGPWVITPAQNQHICASKKYYFLSANTQVSSKS